MGGAEVNGDINGIPHYEPETEHESDGAKDTDAEGETMDDD